MEVLHKLIRKEIKKVLNESFIENKMSKTKKMVKRLKEDTAYQEFFKTAMDKFKINSPADLKDPAKKKEFFDYIDKNYKAKVETINENRRTNATPTNARWY